MNKFFNILGKEIRELVTVKMLVPFLASVLMLFCIGRIMRSERRSAGSFANMNIADFDRTPTSARLIEQLRRKYAVQLIQVADSNAAVEHAKRSPAGSLVIIPGGFEASLERQEPATVDFYSVVRTLGLLDAERSPSARTLLGAINQEIRDRHILDADPDADLEFLKNPVGAREYIVLKNRVSPGSLSYVMGFVAMQTVMIPVVLLMLIIFTATMIASSIGQEKENKTLETLLTVPVSRFSIVAGKMLAAALLAMVFAGLFMFAFQDYVAGFNPGQLSSEELQSSIRDLSSNLGLVLDTRNNLLLGLSVFLSIVAALALATLLALFAQEAKDAQVAVAPLMIMVLIPYFISIMFDPATMSLPLKIFVFAIPFSHTFFAFKYLLLGQYPPVVLGIAYLAVFAGILIFFASRVFATDRILTMKFNWSIRFRRGRAQDAGSDHQHA